MVNNTEATLADCSFSKSNTHSPPPGLKWSSQKLAWFIVVMQLNDIHKHIKTHTHKQTNTQS